MDLRWECARRTAALLRAECAGVLTALAGRVYRLMSLYKGNPPTPRRVLRMLREK